MTAAAFVLPYLPMGTYAVNRFETGWRLQREHGANGHTTLVDGLVIYRPPWWSFPWWQYATVGAAAAAVLAGCVLAAVVARPGLGGYLAAAWVVPMMLLLPVGGIGMPAYIQLWRPGVVASAALGAAAVAEWAWHRRSSWPGMAAATAVATAAAVVAAPAAAAVHRIEHVAPTDYAALPAMVPRRGTVWLVGCLPCARPYLAGRVSLQPVGGTPVAMVIQRSVAVRFPDDVFQVDWARDRGYRMVRSGPLDVWVAPHRS